MSANGDFGHESRELLHRRPRENKPRFLTRHISQCKAIAGSCL
jgi:hypothetical protein